jgi:hypothetical protein
MIRVTMTRKSLALLALVHFRNSEPAIPEFGLVDAIVPTSYRLHNQSATGPEVNAPGRDPISGGIARSPTAEALKLYGGAVNI